MPSESRSHWITAPPMNTLPSSAYEVSPPIRQPTVVSRRFFESTTLPPVFCSMKHPVPYVFLVSPLAKHVCPKSAACWSPATPAIGIPLSSGMAETSPNDSDDDNTVGRIDL